MSGVIPWEEPIENKEEPMTPDQIKEGMTKGKWMFDPQEMRSAMVQTGPRSFFTSGGAYNNHLLVDAANTVQESGLLPSEMRAENRHLTAVLRKLTSRGYALKAQHHNDEWREALEEAESLLQIIKLRKK